MRKITFKIQIYIGLALLLVCFILAAVFQKNIFLNTAWVVYGLLFVINPVYPNQIKNKANQKRNKTYARIAGLICIIIGLITRFGIY